MSSGTLQKDGSIVYPHRGNPPNVPDGFMRDPCDAFRVIPIFDKCDHRTLVNFILPCGKVAGRHWCTLHNSQATPNGCAMCDDQIDSTENQNVDGLTVQNSEELETADNTSEETPSGDESE